MVMVLPFSDTLRQFATVLVSIIHDVECCMVSIHMQGVPLAFGLMQPGSTCFQACVLRETITNHLGQNAFQQAPGELHGVPGPVSGHQVRATWSKMGSSRSENFSDLFQAIRLR